jgi:hypothetical protein
MQAAALLVERGAAMVMLCSRSGHIAPNDLDKRSELLCSASPKVSLLVNDVGDRMESLYLLTSSMPSGVLHAAGTLRDKMLRSMAAADVDAVQAPKAFAASYLHSAMPQRSFESALFFSSVASNFSNLGQSSYAAANAILDALAIVRHLHGTLGRSLQIPAVAGAGMGAASFGDVQLNDLGAISLDIFGLCLFLALTASSAASERVQAPVPISLLRCVATAPTLAELHQLHGAGFTAVDTPSIARVKSDASAFVQQLNSLQSSERQAHTTQIVLDLVQDMSNSEGLSLSADTPILDTGLDSLAATELASKLRTITDAAVSSTLVFEQPTPRAISAHLLELVTDATAMPNCRQESASMAASHSTSAMLQSIMCRWPGGMRASKNVQNMLRAAGDAIGKVPRERWVLDLPAEYFAHYGGFVANAEQFDLLHFGMVPAEAEDMDPQQRLLLEAGYSSLHDADWRRVSLRGASVGVFIGTEHLDWQLLQVLQHGRTVLQRGSPYAASGEQMHVTAGRFVSCLICVARA